MELGAVGRVRVRLVVLSHRHLLLARLVQLVRLARPVLLARLARRALKLHLVLVGFGLLLARPAPLAPKELDCLLLAQLVLVGLRQSLVAGLYFDLGADYPEEA